MNIDTICYKKVEKDSSGNYNINCVVSSGTFDQIILNDSTIWCPSHTLSYGTSSCCCNTTNKTFTVNYYNNDYVSHNVSWSFCDYSGCCECEWKYHTVCYTSSTESSKPGWTCYCNKAYSCAVPCVGTASGSLNTCNYGIGDLIYINDSCIPTGITLSNYNSCFSTGCSTKTYTCCLCTDVSPNPHATGSGVTYTIKFNCNCLTGFNAFCCTYTLVDYSECKAKFPWSTNSSYFTMLADDDDFIYDCYVGDCSVAVSSELNFYPNLNCLTVCSYRFDFNCKRVYITACNNDQCFCGALCIYCVSFDEYQYYVKCDTCGNICERGWKYLNKRCCSITSNKVLYYTCNNYCEKYSLFSICAQNCPECAYRNRKVYYCVLPRCGKIWQNYYIDSDVDDGTIYNSYYLTVVASTSAGEISATEALNYAKRYNYTIEGFCYVWRDYYTYPSICVCPGVVSSVSRSFVCKRTLSDCLIGRLAIDCPSKCYNFTQKVCPYIGTNNEIILKVIDGGPGTTLPNCTLNYNYCCNGTCTCNYTCYYYCCCHYVWTTNKADIATNNGTLDETCCTCCKTKVSGSVTVNANGNCTITKSYVGTIDSISTTGSIDVSRPIKNINVEYFK